MDNPFSWEIIEITDNRVDANAITVQAGSTVTVPDGQQYRWYKMKQNKGEYHVVQPSGCNATVFYNGQDFAYSGDVYEVTESGDYYFKIKVNQNNDGDFVGGNFTVKPFAPLTNTSTSTALDMQLGQKVEFSLIFGSLYYKVNLEAGKTYEMVSSSPRHFMDVELEITDPDGNILNNIESSYSPAAGEGRNRIFTAPSDGTYYIKRSNRWDTQVEDMTLYEVNDERVCSNAIAINLDQTITYDHKELPSIWWKIDVEQGATYLVDFNNNNNDPYNSVHKLSVYESCGMEESLTTSAESFSFVAKQTGSYYLQGTTTGQQDKKGMNNSFRVSRIENHNNTTKASALLIEPNSFTTTNFGFGTTLWYKVALTQGATYELDGRNVGGYAELSIYDTPDDNAKPIESTQYYQLIYITAKSDTEYYIKWVGNENQKAFTWTLNEVVDNRIREKAQLITPGQSITLTSKDDFPTKEYWYKLEVTNGSFYEVDFSNASYKDPWNSDYFEMKYDGEDPDHWNQYSSGKYLIEGKKDGLLYLKVKRYSIDTDLVWTVWQRKQGDNRLCNYAKPIQLDQDVVVDHVTTKYTTQWYAIELESGKTYEVENKGNHRFYCYTGDVCDNPERNGTEIGAKQKVLLSIPETATYYFVSITSELNNNDMNYTWCIREAEPDNRLCEFAEEVGFEETFTADHNNVKTRWFKINLFEGNLYEFTAENVESYNLYIYQDCGDINALAHNDYGTLKMTFAAKTTGFYYLKCESLRDAVASCTINAITDNRSCQFPIKVNAQDTISGTTITKPGLWYSVSLEENKFYEFDFTNTGSIFGRIYSSCGEEKPLTQGKNEKLLFKASQTGDYLVQLFEEYPNDVPWEWTYQEVTGGDNRLCEFAMEMTADTMTVSIEDNIRQFWYKLNVEKDKYYQLGGNYEINLEVYTSCGENTPLAIVNGSWLYGAENTTTLLIKVNATNVYDSAKWYAMEVSPDGKLCSHPLLAELGTDIVSTPEQAMGSGPRESGIWYHFIPQETGIYEIQSDWVDYNSSPADYFWAVQVFTDCSEDSIVTECGHWAHTPQTLFKAFANTDYKIFVPIFDQSMVKNHEWKIVKEMQMSGNIEVTLVKDDNIVIQSPNALVVLYQKIDNTIHVADTLNYGQGSFSSTNIPYGKYLLYAENIGTDNDMQGYLPTWYESAGSWEQATEIVFEEKTKSIILRPIVKPQDIITGDVTISGSVLDKTGEELTDLKDILVNVYRKRKETQSAKGLFRAPSSEWELIAKIKTDVNGHYEINNLPAAEYMIMVDLPGYTSESSAIVVDATEGQNYGNNNFNIDEEQKTITSTTDGIGRTEATIFKMYPNPFSEFVVIENAQGALLEIYSTSGMLVGSRKLTQLRETIRLNELQKGTYVFRIKRDGFTKAAVMIKK